MKDTAARMRSAKEQAFWDELFPPRDPDDLLRELRALFPARWRFLVKLCTRAGAFEVVVPARYVDPKHRPRRVVVVRFVEGTEYAHWALWTALRKRQNGLRDLAWLARIWPTLPTDLPWFMPWFMQGGSEYD